eukprot:TRINITY_DN1376_c0_g2_i3.p1 TRINITY_DN1376_c0_g2~~TRINITY_DN1376_c0_g2_i3.p1  ORF type:complete len:404 (+),score=101.09 TRINITY_DN1376_c0_g2_i3:320-1531(+)
MMPSKTNTDTGNTGYLSARDEEAEGEAEEDVEDSDAFEDQLQRVWAGPMPPQLEEILDILRFPEIFESFGSRMPKGVILSGPPGTGKTWFAKCLAQITHASFFYASASQFDEIYVGRGPQRIRALFAEAAAANKANSLKANQASQSTKNNEVQSSWWRRVLFGRSAAAAAESQPQPSSSSQEAGTLGHAMSIIFIDEIDALGQRGGLMSGDARHATLSELLTQMDGMSSDSFGTILVIAATNNLALIDPALLRSGRFDRIVSMPLPTEESRYAIIQHYLKEKPLSDSMQGKGALEALATATEGFNCADLKNMINECTIAATRAAVALRKQNRRKRRVEKGNQSPGIVSFQIDATHFLAAFDSVYAKIKKERPQDPLLSRKSLASVLAPLYAQETLNGTGADPD